jgi:peptidoglycan/xylan/chitin deacetylase (PgdA/CDA1 family)
MAAVRVLVQGAAGDVLEMPGHQPVALGPRAHREPAVRAVTRALVPLGPAARAERIAAAAARYRVDVAAALAGSMLDWARVRELAAAGWTIGAHTVSHLNVALAPAAEAEAEIAASRDAIAAALGTPPRHFAYPNTGGQHRYFDADAGRLLARLGFRSAVTSRPGALRPGADPFMLPRLGVSPRLAPVIELAAALERQRLAA